MSFLNNLFSSKIKTEPNTVYKPVEGEVFPLKDLNDGVFSEKILGDGCAIRPFNQNIFAPFDGVVSTVSDTQHAIGLTSHDGIELLIHVGLDTVEMNGEGFKVLVKDGQKVKAGQNIMQFSISKIENAGYPTDVIVVVTNSFDYDKIVTLNHVSKAPLVPLINVVRK